MKRFIMALLVFGSINAAAQDSTNKISSTITKKTFGPYKMDGNRISAQQLKEEIYKVPAAIPLYKKAKTSKILGYSFFVPAIVFALTTSQGNYHHRSDSTYGPRRGLQIASLLSGGASVYFLFHSLTLYKKAVRARNSSLKTIY